MTRATSGDWVSRSSGCRVGERCSSWTDACGQGRCGIASLPRRPAPTPRSQPDADHRPVRPDRPQPARRRPVRAGRDRVSPRTPRVPARSSPCSTSRRSCCATARAGRSRSSQARHPQRHPRRRPLALQQPDPGQQAATIDELPLEWFFADGVVLDMTAQGRRREGRGGGRGDRPGDIGYALKPLDIVLMRTGRDAFYGQPDYVLRGCAVTPEATRWLFDRGVRVMGIDAWGWDGPLDRQAGEALARQEPGVFWAAHQCDLPYSQIERLVNLGRCRPRVQGGLLPAQDPGRQRRTGPGGGDLGGLIRVVAWLPSSTARATTSPPWGLSGCTRLMAENTDWDGGATMGRTKAKLIVYRRVSTARQGDQRPWPGGTGRGVADAPPRRRGVGRARRRFRRPSRPA